MKDGSSADQLVSSQGSTRPRIESSAHGKAKLDAEKILGEVVAEWDKVPEVKAEIEIEGGTSSQWPPKWTVRFPKSDHPVSLDSRQKKSLRTTVARMAPAPCWCPPGLTSN
jgi:hypothetical protein